jgi:hypothetical protein
VANVGIPWAILQSRRAIEAEHSVANKNEGDITEGD